MQRFSPFTVPLLFFGVFLCYYVMQFWVIQVIPSATLEGSIKGKQGDFRQVVDMPHLTHSPRGPFAVPANRRMEYIYRFQLERTFNTGNWFQIIADDCVEEFYINKAPVGLADKTVCNIRKGFFVNLDPYLQDGVNHVEITVSNNNGGDYGLRVEPLLFKLSHNMHTVIASFSLIACLWSYLLIRLRIPWPMQAVSIISLFISIVIYQHTSAGYHGPDWWGHLPYIRHMAQNWEIPDPSDGWQFYQQPLYYMLAALWGHAGRFLDIGFLDGARYLSVFCTLVFIVYGLLILRRVIHVRWLLYLCMTAWMFWPLMPALYGRMTNEIMVYPLWTMSMYYLLRWHQDKHARDLAVSIAVAGVTMLVKTTALVPLGTIGVVFLYSIWKKATHWRALLTPMVVCALIVAMLATGFNFGRTLYYQLDGQPKIGFIIGNLYKHSGKELEYSDNALYKFITLDIDKLFHTPFLDYANDDSGRLLFWHSYIKSSMFGIGRWPYPQLAIILSVLLVGLVLYTTFVALWMRKHMNVMLCAVAALMAAFAQMINRIINMTVGTQDARMTLPVVIMFIAFMGVVADYLIQKRYWVWTMPLVAMLLAFVVTSIYYAIKTAIYI